jgi:hypothetical protein
MQREDRLERSEAGQWALRLAGGRGPVVTLDGRQHRVAPGPAPDPALQGVELELVLEAADRVGPRIRGEASQKQLDQRAGVAEVAGGGVRDAADPVVELVS